MPPPSRCRRRLCLLSSFFCWRVCVRFFEARFAVRLAARRTETKQNQKSNQTTNMTMCVSRCALRCFARSRFERDLYIYKTYYIYTWKTEPTQSHTRTRWNVCACSRWPTANAIRLLSAKRSRCICAANLDADRFGAPIAANGNRDLCVFMCPDAQKRCETKIPTHMRFCMGPDPRILCVKSARFYVPGTAVIERRSTVCPTLSSTRLR